MSRLFSIVVATVVSVIASGAFAADYVVGSFEGTTLGGGTGWKDWSGGDTYSNSTTGATNGTMSIKYEPDSFGYQQGLAVKLQDIASPGNANAFNGFMANTAISVDVTWNTADWTYNGSGWNGARLLMYYNEQGGGYHQIGVPLAGDANGFMVPNADTGNPTNPGFWDITNYPGIHTRTMTWDYSAFKAAVTSNGSDGWTEFFITNNAGNFSTGAFYFDNIRFTTPPAGVQGDYSGNGVVDAADYTTWRDHLGQTFALANRSPLNTGAIGQADYDFWKSRFGQTSGSGALSAAAVPEPASLMLVLAAALLAPFFVRRK